MTRLKLFVNKCEVFLQQKQPPAYAEGLFRLISELYLLNWFFSCGVNHTVDGYL